MTTTKAIGSFQNNNNLQNPPKPQSRVLDSIQQMLESFLQQADALANNPNCTTDLLGKLEQIDLPPLNQESQGSYPENRLQLLESTVKIYALIHRVLTNQNFKSLKGGVSDPSYKAIKSSLKAILSGLSQISEKPPSDQGHTSLHHLNSDAFRVIASYLTTEELISLARLFKCRAYAHLIPTVREVYYKKNPPRIFPCNYGTLIASGAPTMRLFFTGSDPAGQMDSLRKPSCVFLREIEALRHRSIVSVNDTTHVAQDFPKNIVSGSQLILCANGKAYSSNFRRGHCGFTPVDIPDPVIEIASQRSVGHFLRTKQSIYKLQETGLFNLTSIPKPDNIVKMIAGWSLLALRYSDGIVKIFDNHYLELPVFLETEQVTLQSVEIFHTRGCIFISMNSRFFQVAQMEGTARLSEYPYLAGKKITKMAGNANFVFTEKEGVWASGVNRGGCLGIGNTIFQEDYIQVRTLDNIREVFDISNIFDFATLFLAGGKLYFAGAGQWRYLVSKNPQEEYTVPTPISNTSHLTIKSVWNSGKNIWVLAETGVYQLSTVDNPLESSRRYDAPPIHYFRDLESIPFNIAMLTAWNKMYAEWIFKSAELLDADDVIRKAISSSSNLDELYAKLEKPRAYMPTCTDQFFEYLKTEKKAADEPQA